MAKKVVRLTESELMNIVEQCVYEYQQTLINESKLGKLARTAALGAGLAGGILGGMNTVNAQNPNNNISLVQTRDNLGRKTYKLQRDDQFDKDIRQQMQDNITLKKYQDSVAAEERKNDIEQSPAFRAIDSVDNKSMVGKTIIKGNGSTNPNDYHYYLTIIPIGKYGGIRNEYLIDDNDWVMPYTDITPIFKHMFNNYNEFIQYLPKIMKKLQFDNNDNYDFSFKVTVMGLEKIEKQERIFSITPVHIEGGRPELKNNQFKENDTTYYTVYYRFRTQYNCQDINKLVSRQVKGLITPIVKTIKQYGDYQNQYRTPQRDARYLGYDKNGNTIYQNKDGVKYIWDASTEEFVPMNKFNSFSFDDLNNENN